MGVLLVLAVPDHLGGQPPAGDLLVPETAQGGWDWFGIALIVLHFALPFLLLLAADANRNTRVLSTVAILVVVMRAVDLFWLVRPVFSPGHFEVHWLDLAAFVALGGLWLSFLPLAASRTPASRPATNPEYAPRGQRA